MTLKCTFPHEIGKNNILTVFAFFSVRKIPALLLLLKVCPTYVHPCHWDLWNPIGVPSTFALPLCTAFIHVMFRAPHTHTQASWKRYKDLMSIADMEKKEKHGLSLSSVCPTHAACVCSYFQRYAQEDFVFTFNSNSIVIAYIIIYFNVTLRYLFCLYISNNACWIVKANTWLLLPWVNTMHMLALFGCQQKGTQYFQVSMWLILLNDMNIQAVTWSLHRDNDPRLSAAGLEQMRSKEDGRCLQQVRLVM